jgi:8-oxo-dGTP diphosphatase
VARQIDVVGAVIVNDGLVLCAQRGPAGALAGLWEFPGGKVEPGEAARDALAREIAEELGCVVEVGDEVTTTSHEYDFGVVILTTFWCRLVEGTPDLTEHADITWLAPAEMDTLAWAPADIPAVALVRAQLATRDTRG